MKKYTINNERISSDKKKKSWHQGDLVSDADFPKKIIKRWLDKGVLLPVKEEEQVEEKQAADEKGDEV